MFANRKLSPYTAGFALLMALAGGEALALGVLTQLQKTDASMSNLGGPQRMRTQRIAFLTEEAIDPGLSSDERVELTNAIDSLIVTQRELDGDPDTRIGVMQSGGSTDLEDAVQRYATAASAVVANPKGARDANAYLLANRLPLLKALDAAVEARKAQSDARKRILWAAVAGLLGLMALVVVATWRFVGIPLERHLVQSREQLRSLFEDNPDAVTTYDLDGKVINANAAAAALLGYAQDGAIDHRFASSIAEDARAAAYLAFARSAAGDAAKIETTIVRPDGTRIDVSASLLPSVVDGKIDGVYAIARDVTQERLDQRALAEQAKRIRELYLVAASAGQSSEEQIVRALEMGCSRLNLEWGFVSEMERSRATIRVSVGDGTYGPGASLSVAKDLIRQTLATNDVVVIEDPRSNPVAADPSQRSGKLETFVTFPIHADGKPYGAVCFASAIRRERPLSESDRDFIRLIGALIGASIERAETKRRLDAMAFSDPLTGLPNRASLDASVEDLIGKARRGEDRFAVHFLDLDDFKAVNDEHGHAVGDALLQAVARRLRDTIGPNDIAARLGGDEFIILQPGALTAGDAAVLASKVIAAIDEPIELGGAPTSVGASIGIALYPADGTDVQTLFSNADRALYRAKSFGRGRYLCAATEPLIR